MWQLLTGLAGVDGIDRRNIVRHCHTHAHTHNIIRNNCVARKVVSHIHNLVAHTLVSHTMLSHAALSNP